MYIEYKGEEISGPARIGRVTFSKTGKSVYYQGRMFYKTARAFGKANFIEAETGEEYWISGCKKNGADRLYSGTVEIDDDVREEYWTEIRKKPEKKDAKSVRARGKYSW
jgi:hypothetical protein